MPSQSSFTSAFTALFGRCIAADDHSPSPPTGVAPSRPADRPEGAISRTRREWLESLADVVRRDLTDLPNNCALKHDLAALLSRSRERRPSDEDEFAHPCADIRDLMVRTVACVQRVRRWDTASACTDRLGAGTGDRSAYAPLRDALAACHPDIAGERHLKFDLALASIHERLVAAGPPQVASFLAVEPDRPSPRLKRMRDNLDWAELSDATATESRRRLRETAEMAEILHQLRPDDLERRLDALAAESEHVVTTELSRLGWHQVPLRRQGNAPQVRPPLPAHPPVGKPADWPYRAPPTIATHHPDLKAMTP
ncbi:hypothetical protein [Roseateles chitinivorans]|uniref:hypothetical protein n=1 Tax=Roseateles chitinivorans TaxID=2917965 RepID=UPI003D669C63